MYESVEVGGLTPTPNPFLVVDFYNQNRACLLPEKGLPAPGPYSTPLRTPLWNGSNHCTYRPSLCHCRKRGRGWAVGVPVPMSGDVGPGVVGARVSCVCPSPPCLSCSGTLGPPPPAPVIPAAISVMDFETSRFSPTHSKGQESPVPSSLSGFCPPGLESSCFPAGWGLGEGPALGLSTPRGRAYLPRPHPPHNPGGEPPPGWW